VNGYLISGIRFPALQIGLGKEQVPLLAVETAILPDSDFLYTVRDVFLPMEQE